MNKSLYGLKQSERVWYETFVNEIKKEGFKSIYDEACLFYSDKNDAIICVYVDDLLIISKDIKIVEEIKCLLSNKFEMKDMGVVSQMLGIKINYNQDKGLTTLDMSGYIKRSLIKFNLENVRMYKMPIEPNYKYSVKHAPQTQDELLEMKNKPYAAAFGTLNWIAMTTRPDIAFATNICGRYASNPGIKHWNLVKRIFGYLKRTIDLKINYKRSNDKIKGYTDADFAGCTDTRKSTTGYAFTLAGGPISWKSKRQKCVSMSTAESEYIAIGNGVKEALWLRKLMTHINKPSKEGTEIYTDNTAAYQNVKSNVITGSELRHVDIYYHFSKDRQESNQIQVKNISTNHQVADLFTKGFNNQKLLNLCNQLGLFIDN